MSRLITNAIRSTSASADAITMDGSGNVTFPANATCSGTATGFGKILQVQETVKTDTTSATSTDTWEDISGLSVSITPANSSNKILILATVNVCCTDTTYYALRLQKGGSAIFVGDSSGNRSRVFAGKRDYSDNFGLNTDNLNFTDTAGGTSAITYNIGWYNPYGTSTRYLNRTVNDENADYRFRTASSITVIEVAA